MMNEIKTTELANFLGKTNGWATNLKKGRKKLPPKDCLRVSERFNIPLNELRPDIFGK